MQTNRPQLRQAVVPGPPGKELILRYDSNVFEGWILKKVPSLPCIPPYPGMAIYYKSHFFTQNVSPYPKLVVPDQIYEIKFSTNDSKDQIARFYESTLPRYGWKMESHLSDPLVEGLLEEVTRP